MSEQTHTKTNFRTFSHANFPQFEIEILDYWKTNQIFEKAISQRSPEKAFVFYEGPPSANGKPGIHHVMSRAIKDIFCRYQTLKGHRVYRKAGWDTHGLPVELSVEKELGITKEDIGKKISIIDYNKACKETVMRYTDIWNQLTERIGYWVNMDDPYITYKSKYMETVWWLIKQIYDKNLLYKGYTIQPYSPKAGTGLSSNEVNQPGSYRDVTDTTIIAQFEAIYETLNPKLQNNAKVYFLAWTTTPWTLPSNTALSVGKKIEYVLVKTFNQYTFEPIQVVLAKNLINSVFSNKFIEVNEEHLLNDFNKEDKKIPYFVDITLLGYELEGIKYHQLMPLCKPHMNPEHAFRIITADFVTTDSGTGIVHTAPTFGADDAKAAKNAIPEVPAMLVLNDKNQAVPLVDLQGKFINGLGYLSGKYVKNEYYNDNEAPEKSVDVEIAIQLKEENKAFKVEKYVHSYPHCWRTDKPILYYPLDSWFIKISDVKDRMFDLNESINWKPKSTGEGRFGNWLKSSNDWNLSRSRYWGIPIPIWRTKDQTEEICIGSVKELIQEIEKSIQAGLQKENPFQNFEIDNMSDQNYDLIDLHKNIVDSIVLVSKSGQAMYRETDLLDVWFDSGSMPYAQWHYPFENKELIDQNKQFPADFIAEGVDQTRGWFYTLHAISTMVFDKVAYKNVVSNGLVLDKNGVKMSKRLSNTIEPFEAIEQYGADIIRWYMVSNSPPWDNLKFDISGVDETKKKFFGTLYNTYSFFALYANLDQFNHSEDDMAIEDRPELDRWILSKLNNLIKEVDTSFTEYDPTFASRKIQEFTIDLLSNWYVRLSRRRFWKNENSNDKLSAYQTLYHCLEIISILAAPISPFFTDTIFQALNQVSSKNLAQSVHLADFPICNPNYLNDKLEHKMELAQNICSLVLGIRKKEKIKVRQPLQKIIIPVLDIEQQNHIIDMKDIILSETNIKEIEFLTNNNSDLIVKSAKPDFKKLGQKYGSKMKQVAQAIVLMNAKEINDIETNGLVSLKIENDSFQILIDEIEIVTKDVQGWQIASNKGITLALDMTITDELQKEGLAREIINRIQNLRKDLNYDVSDKISIDISNNPLIINTLKMFDSYICTETLANEINPKPNMNGEMIEINGIQTQLTIKKI